MPSSQARLVSKGVWNALEKHIWDATVAVDLQVKRDAGFGSGRLDHPGEQGHLLVIFVNRGARTPPAGPAAAISCLAWATSRVR
jgi:hypothetical protein